MGVDVYFFVAEQKKPNDDGWKIVEEIWGDRAANYECLDDGSLWKIGRGEILDKDGLPMAVDMYGNDDKFMFTTKGQLLAEYRFDFTKKQIKAFEKYPDEQKIIVGWF